MECASMYDMHSIGNFWYYFGHRGIGARFGSLNSTTMFCQRTEPSLEYVLLDALGRRTYKCLFIK
jgi:hypothetical protein